MPVRRARFGRPGRRGTGRRLLGAGVVIAALIFAVQGGEYSTFDLLSQGSARATLDFDIAELRTAVDSLTEWKQALDRDPFVQERIAREEFGMVRGDSELLYRFLEEPDTSR